jgi:glyoxylase-like metal-dependent hydrolase (beta-lactamase superfamily II)
MSKLMKLADDLFWIEGSDYCSNAYVLKDDKNCIVIDTGDGTTDIEKELDRKPDYCMLTHGHIDHTGGVKEDWNTFLRPEDFRSEFPYKVPSSVKKLDLENLKLGSFDLEIMHTPGHTRGGICILERKRDILFTGDTLFSEGWIGRTDMPGGNDRDMIASLKLLLGRFAKDKDAKIIIPFDFDSCPLNVSFLCSGHGTPKRF